MSAIQLRNGPLVDEAAIRLALQLEDAGHRMATTDGKLTVTNGAALSPETRQQIKALRRHLMALVAYDAPEAR